MIKTAPSFCLSDLTTSGHALLADGVEEAFGVPAGALRGVGDPGGELSQQAIVGAVYTSTDGGDSFVVSQVPDYYLTAMSFPAPGVGYAAAMTLEGTCNILKYTA